MHCRTLAQGISVVLTALLLVQSAGAQQTPAAPQKLNLVIVEGEGAVNNVRQRVAREPIVQVEDENRRPVAGAAVTFLLPNQGAGATFANGARSLTVLTDNQGRAVARGLQPNNVNGQFQIRVNASHQGQTASTAINMTNSVVAGAVAGGISAKLIAILAIAGAAAAGGAIAATRGGNDNGTTTTTQRPPIRVGAGTPTVGAP